MTDTPEIADVLAAARCRDVHSFNWPASAGVMACSACQGWGVHIAAALPAPIPADGPLTDDERARLTVAVSCGLRPTLTMVEALLAQREEGLRRRVKRAYLYALDRRRHWAHEGSQLGAARAVAYQSIAGQLQRALEADSDD